MCTIYNSAVTLEGMPCCLSFHTQARLAVLAINLANALLLIVSGATRPSFFHGKRRIILFALVFVGQLVFTVSLQLGIYPGTGSAPLPLIGFESKTILVRQMFDLILFQFRGLYTALVHPHTFVMLRARLELKPMSKAALVSSKERRRKFTMEE